MGTQGKGSRVSAICGDAAAWRWRQRTFAKLSTFLSVLIVVIALWTSAAHAQTTNYVYDASGRVVAVTQNNGPAAQYTYDTLGHLAQTTTVASGQLAIFAFIPTHGEAGTEVTIEGQGFNASPASDTVAFNGTPATVVSASTTQIVTIVPSGATTGPISVSVGGNTAISPFPFVIDDTGLPPTISTISPILVNAGATVTVTGTQLDPVANATTVSVGGTTVQPTAFSASQIQLTATSSGYIGVQTPFGTATSAQPLIVLPGSVATSNVVSSGYEVPNGTPVTLNLGATNQVGALLVQAAANSWVSILATGVSPTSSSISYTVYAPNGLQVMQGSVSASSPSIHLPKVSAAGTYTLVFQSNTASTQLTLASTLDAALNMGVATTVTSAVGDQSQRVLFNASAGQTLDVALTNTTTSPAGYEMYYTVYAPDGSTYTTGSWSSSSTGINLSNLSMSGTYQLVIAANNIYTTNNATYTTQVELFPGVSGTLPTTGVSQSYSSLGAGENISLTFAASQGQNLEVTLNNISVTGTSSTQFYAYIYNAAGTEVTYASCSPASPASCRASLWNLPAGIYTLLVTPPTGGVLSFQTVIEPDVIGPSLVPGTPASISLAAGQVERLTFTGTLGQNVALGLSGATTAPAGETVDVAIYRPDVGLITIGDYYDQISNTSGLSTVNLPSLPASGTYTVIVSDVYGTPLTAQLTLATSSTGSQLTNGTSQSYAAPVAGQYEYFGFTATQGQNLELTLNDISTTSGSVNVTVNTSTGTNVASESCSASSPGASCRLPLWNLAAGNYSVTVEPSSSGTLQFNALIEPDVIGPQLTSGTPANINLGAGQVERFTFNGTLGSTVALGLTGDTTTPTGQWVYVYVYQPNGGLITPTGYYTFVSAQNGSPGVLNLTNLPASGTYTVVVATQYGIPAAGQLTLASGATGTLATNGTAQSYSTILPLQQAYLSFTATQGQNLELSFNDITNVAGGGADSFSVNVYSAVGVYINSGSCGSGNPGSSCIIPLWNLPAGTYSVQVVGNGNLMQFNAAVQPDVAGPALPVGSAENINIGQGQAERFSFNANSGDVVVLQTSGLATVPSGQSLCIDVYRPDTGLVTTNGEYSQTCSPSSTGATINLSNLPAGGTYTVVATTQYGSPVTGSIELLSDTAGSPPTYGTATLPQTGAPQSEQSSAAGQPVSMTFNATQGQSLELALDNIVSTGSVYVAVDNVAGTTIAGFSCYSSNPGASCRQPLWNLAAGTYTVVVTPASGATLQFNALLQPDIVGPSLTVGTPTTVTLGVGQVERLTFSGTLGQNVALDLSGVSTTPSGQTVYMMVFSPETGSVITTTNYYKYTSSTGSVATLNLPNLPATGIYTVVMYDSYGDPASAQVTLANSVTGTLPTNGTTQNYAATETGQDVYFSFTATQGQNLDLTISNTNGTTQFNVYNAAGTSVTSFSCTTYTSTPTCLEPLWNLPAGTYSVIANAESTSTGPLQFSALMQPDITGTSLSSGTSVNINLSSGQVERFTFSGVQGENVALSLSGVVTAPAGQYAYMYIYRPDVGPITLSNEYKYTYTLSGTTVNLQNLPVTGTYTVVVFVQSFGLPLTAQLTLVSNTTTNVLTNGTSQSIATTLTGQDAYFTFTATQGQNLELSLNSINSSSSVDVYNASGSSVATFTCSYSSTTTSCMQPLWNLQAGTYSVIVTPYSSTLTQFNASIQPDVIGPTITATTPATINLTAGQTERVTFQGAQGEAATLQLSGVSTTSPAGQAVYVNIYRPDGGLITPGASYAQLSSVGATTTLSFPNLPATGTYTAVVSTYLGQPATAQLSFVASGGGSLNGSPSPFVASGSGQVLNLNFNATAGENLELTLNNINLVGATSNYFEVLVTNPSGTLVADSFCYVPTANASCSLSLWNVSNGTYSVVATPYFGGTISFNAFVLPDVVGPGLVSGTPTEFNLSSGEVERVQFAGTAGGSATLQLADVSTTPTNQNVYVYIYRPDVGVIETYNSYASLQTDSSGSIALSNLPVTGNYTAVITTGTGIPANAQLTYTSQ
jgi:YD repeat-containing protein